MAISLSPRVRRNIAQQMTISHRYSTTSSNKYSIQCLLLISNEVPVPTQSNQIYNYLNTCLNNSAYGGTSGANYNQRYVLAYRPITTTEARTMNQTGTLVQLTTPWNMIVNASGTIGSAIMLGVTYTTSTGLSLTNNSGGASTALSASGFPLDANSATGTGGVMLSKAMTQANFDAYAPEYFSSYNFITDSIATSGTPFIKVSSMTTTVGQSLTVSGFKVRINNLNS